MRASSRQGAVPLTGPLPHRKAVVKAFDPLEIRARDTPMGVTEPPKRTDPGRSNAHCLLRTLPGPGFVQQTDDSHYQAFPRQRDLGGRITFHG